MFAVVPDEPGPLSLEHFKHIQCEGILPASNQISHWETPRNRVYLMARLLMRTEEVVFWNRRTMVHLSARSILSVSGKKCCPHG